MLLDFVVKKQHSVVPTQHWSHAVDNLWITLGLSVLPRFRQNFPKVGKHFQRFSVVFSQHSRKYTACLYGLPCVIMDQTRFSPGFIRTGTTSIPVLLSNRSIIPEPEVPASPSGILQQSGREFLRWLPWTTGCGYNPSILNEQRNRK